MQVVFGLVGHCELQSVGSPSLWVLVLEHADGPPSTQFFVALGVDNVDVVDLPSHLDLLLGVVVAAIHCWAVGHLQQPLLFVVEEHTFDFWTDPKNKAVLLACTVVVSAPPFLVRHH